MHRSSKAGTLSQRVNDMTRARRRRFPALVPAAALICLLWSPGQAQRACDHFVATWSTATVGRPQNPQPVAPPVQPAPGQPAAPPPPPFMHFNNQTLRQIVHTSLGGSQVRLVLTNVFGTTPLT